MVLHNPFSLEVQEEGVVVATRNRVNFVGDLVTATWDAANDRIKVDLASSDIENSSGIISFPNQSKSRAFRNGDWYVADSGEWIRVPLNAESYDNKNEFNTTSKTGTADGTVADHLQDDTASQFSAADVGKWVYNTTDYTYATITAFNDAGDVTLDEDIFVNGEGYEIYSSTFTVTEDGYYLVCGVVRCNWTEADTWYFVGVEKNGGLVSTGGFQSSVGNGVASNYLSAVVADVISLVADDEITLALYHGEASAAKFRGETSQTFLSIHKLS